ncbi:MAG: GAF domain-containing protein [Chitinophagaceae bacterium]
MTTEEISLNERKRLETLRKYNILDTPPDGSFDRITKLASTIFKVPIAIISLVDTDRIWFKSHYGLSVNQIGRDPGLCASAILSNDVHIIEDAVLDPRSLSNPLVAGEFGLRFYAGTPLQTEDNYNLGTLCIIDKVPRTLTIAETEILKQLGEMVMREMELRVALRNTVTRIKTLSVDISNHLDDTIKNLESVPVDDQKGKILSYLDASRMFFVNMENQLDQL